MGHSISGFAFGALPDTRKLAAEFSQLTFLVAKHKASPLWLLSARSALTDEPRYPFNEFMYLGDGYVDVGEDKFAEILDQCVAATDDGYAASLVSPAVNLALALNRILQIPTLYFLANDDGVDLALLAENGRISAFRSQADFGYVEVSCGDIVVQPEIAYLEEGEEEDVADIDDQFECLRSLEDVIVRPLKIFLDGGEPLGCMHDSALKIWPSNWPDPSDSLGIGTWNAFRCYPEEFEVEIIHSSPPG